MTLRSPSASFAAKLVYDSGVDAEPPASGSTVDSSSEDNPFTEDTEEEDIKDEEGKSMYVTLFEGASAMPIAHVAYGLTPHGAQT